MELSGKRAAVLVEQQYQEMEVWYPVYRLREAGCKVTLVGPEAGHTYPSKLGYPAKSDKAAADVSADDFDILVIPGGFAPDYLRRNEAILRLVSTMAEQGKVVAAICHGPWVLCSTQALKGKRATCFFAIKDDVSNAGATYVDAEVLRDGNLITSRKPDDLPAFMQAILQAVKEAKPAMARCAEGRSRTPPPAPSPKRRGEKEEKLSFLLPLSASGRGLGGGVLRLWRKSASRSTGWCR